MSITKIKIKSSRDFYSVEFTDQISKILDVLTTKYHAHFLIDCNIHQVYKSELDDSIKKARSVYFFDPSEKKKNLKEIYKFIDFLLAKKIQKNHKLIVIGGGLIQDIGSFTSHIILRGVDWIFIPTTLLAMADSCIGAKSGINVGKYKNQIGSFHHPSEIYIYSAFLKTLPSNDLLNGIGEIVKHLFIKGNPVFSRIYKKLQLMGKDMSTSKKIIYESLLIKKDIVEEDEYEEKNIRKLLNYGHTFGHALEGYTKNKIPHGLGVLFGMDIANYISLKRGILSEDDFLILHQSIRQYLPVKKIPIKDVNLYLEFLSKDKKAVGTSINALLCKGLGKVIITKIDLDTKLTQEIKQYCQFYNQEA